MGLTPVFSLLIVQLLQIAMEICDIAIYLSQLAFHSLPDFTDIFHNKHLEFIKLVPQLKRIDA